MKAHYFFIWRVYGILLRTWMQHYEAEDFIFCSDLKFFPSGSWTIHSTLRKPCRVRWRFYRHLRRWEKWCLRCPFGGYLDRYHRLFFFDYYSCLSSKKPSRRQELAGGYAQYAPTTSSSYLKVLVFIGYRADRWSAGWCRWALKQEFMCNFCLINPQG